jgi:diguanylate cyclase (GGDEF)-like protein/putative nucleotidyltransferase with HDIG domain
VNPLSDPHIPSGTLGIVLGLGGFTLLNHLMVGVVLRLARGQSFSESGVFGFLTLMIDYGLLCIGAGAALEWTHNPSSIIVSLIPLYLIYSTLRLPALERKADTDSKTGLYNAAYFNAHVRQELERAQRFERPMTIVMADLDLLRNINNNYGHVAGDVVLKGVAEIIKGKAREYDLVARFGGEEFAVLMPEMEPHEALPLVEEMRLAIHNADFPVSTSVKPIKATMSFGVAGRSGSAQTLEGLVHHADVALYKAKAAGRNQTVLFGGNSMLSPIAVAEGDILAADGPPTPRRLEFAEDNGREPVSSPKPEPEQNPVPAEPAPLAAAGAQAPPPRWQVNAYIGVVALVAAALVVTMFSFSADLDWLGLALFVGAALLTEALSVEIYVRDTAVSTSAALLVAGAMLFGPLGALVMGVATAVPSVIKNRSGFSRLIFNASNFTIGNFLCVLIISLAGTPLEQLGLMAQFAITIVAAAVVYLSTTVILAGVVSANTGQRHAEVWTLRFRWLAPYYIAMGVVSSAILFSYSAAGPLGVIIIIVPLFMLRFSQAQYLDHTKALVSRLRQNNKELTEQAAEITLLNEELLLTLAHSADLRDPYVMEHSKHVSRYAMLVAQELDLPAERVDQIRKAGLLHDIGKLGIPEKILFKPDKLSQDEYERVKVHVEIGADLIFRCHSLHGLIPSVKHHHERYDGHGYPAQLAGEEIPLEARILGLADAVEAMASDRPYKTAMTPKEILAEVKRNAGLQFDPLVIRAFERVLQRQGESVIVNSARNVESAPAWKTDNGVPVLG